jgi:predicted phosphate transport protein (TIGR00153 family)
MFTRINLLKKEMESYLDKIQIIPVILELGIKDYLEGRFEDFQRQAREIKKTESELDAIRRDIEQKMYKYTLLPESRRDILSLIERLDDVANFSERLMKSIRAETPSIPKSCHEKFLKMAEINVLCIKDLADSLERYFNNNNYISASVGKVRYYEHEVDVIYEDLITEVFQSMELPLDRKIHIRYFAEKLSRISDTAEDVSEYLIIASLKREI